MSLARLRLHSLRVRRVPALLLFSKPLYLQFVQKLWAMAKQPSALVRRVQSCETLRHHPQAGRWTLTGVSATVEDI